MFDNIKHNIPTIEIAIGYIVYIFLIIQTTFSLAALWMMFIVYLWLLSSLYLNKYTFNAFLYIICSAGMALAISFFFLQGVEELPYPEGALMFHTDGIAKSFFLFFICTVPLILVKSKTRRCESQPKLNKSSGTETWEEATPEDLDSGNYEPL